MKRLPFVLLMLLPLFVTSQEKSQWRRIFKYEDGTVIELDTASVTFGLTGIARLKFRLVWAKPETMKGIPGGKYKTRMERVEFKCTERKYRRLEMTLLDPDGKPVSNSGEMTDGWEDVKPKNMMIRIFNPACALIDEKRLNPDEEP